MNQTTIIEPVFCCAGTIPPVEGIPT